jgi:pyruvate dehydrogenase E1 component
MREDGGARLAGQRETPATSERATMRNLPPNDTSVQRMTLIKDGFAAQMHDIDPEETAEWLASFDSMLDAGGQQRARYLMLRLLARAKEQHIALPALTTTDYINTIPTESEPFFPGDEEIERRYRGFIRWNAAMLVHRAQRPGIGVGGHISTYASSASLYEVGFNHFWRG